MILTSIYLTNWRKFRNYLNLVSLASCYPNYSRRIFLCLICITLYNYRYDQYLCHLKSSKSCGPVHRIMWEAGSLPIRPTGNFFWKWNKFFFNLVPSSEETSFLTTSNGLYFSHHYTHFYTLQIMLDFLCGQLFLY